MEKRLRHTLALFAQEARDDCRVLAIGLHPHLISVPHRMHELVGMIDALQAHPDVLFTTGAALCDWFTAASPPPSNL